MASPATTSIILGVAGAMAGYDMAAMNGACTGTEWQGATIGWTVGSAIGASLAQLPPGQEPRMNELKLQSSQYGEMIPILFGTSRISGQVIWSSELIETSHTQTASGKGWQSQEQTYYSYSIHCAIALCEGVIAGIDSVWANGTLVGNSNNSLGDCSGYRLRKYLGTETQLADSLLESYLGVGNVPAHRGMAYVVLENLQLARYGNQLPSFSFEVIKDGAVNTTNLPTYYGPRDDSIGNVYSLNENPYIHGQMVTLTIMTSPSSVTVKFVVYDWINGTTRTIDTGVPISLVRGTVYLGGLCHVECTQEYWLPINRGTGSTVAIALNLLTYSVRLVDVLDKTIWGLAASTDYSCFYNKESRTVCFVLTSTGGNYNNLDPFDGYSGSPISGGNMYNSICRGFATNLFSCWNGGFKIIDGNGVVGGNIKINNPTNGLDFLFDSTRRRYIVRATDRVVGFATYCTIEEDGGNITYYDSNVPTNKLMSDYLECIDKYFYTAYNGISLVHEIVFIDPTTFQITETLTLPTTVFNPIIGTRYLALCEDDPNHIIFATTYTANTYVNIIRCELRPSIISSSPTVAAVITSICGKVALAAGDINVTNLTSITVDGIAISNRAPARESIESLQSAYFFDVVESD